MIKMCDKAIIKPLSIIYKNCIDTGIFPDLWNKSNIVPVHKKEINNCYKITEQFLCYLSLEKFLRKFCSIYCLNIYKKIACFVKISLVLEHMIHVNISFSPYFTKYMHHLTVTSALGVTTVFLDISEAFHRVWYEGLIYKIKSMGISGLPIKLIQSFLNNRLKRVVLNGQTSAWAPVLTGVLQGSILDLSLKKKIYGKYTLSMLQLYFRSLKYKNRKNENILCLYFINTSFILFDFCSNEVYFKYTSEFEKKYII